MKILAVSGSRRKNGNTAMLLKKTLEPFNNNEHETELIFLGELNFEGCRGCEGCSKSGLCVIHDDMQILYKKIADADAIIAGSPTYFFNMTSDMKKFIDRCYCFFSFAQDDRSVWISRIAGKTKKLAGLITVCEQNNYEDMGFTSRTMYKAFESLGFRIIFDQKVHHAFNRGDVAGNKEQLDAAYDNGLRLMKTFNLYTEANQNIETLDT